MYWIRAVEYSRLSNPVHENVTAFNILTQWQLLTQWFWMTNSVVLPAGLNYARNSSNLNQWIKTKFLSIGIRVFSEFINKCSLCSVKPSKKPQSILMTTNCREGKSQQGEVKWSVELIIFEILISCFQGRITMQATGGSNYLDIRFSHILMRWSQQYKCHVESWVRCFSNVP